MSETHFEQTSHLPFPWWTSKLVFLLARHGRIWKRGRHGRTRRREAIWIVTIDRRSTVRSWRLPRVRWMTSRWWGPRPARRGAVTTRGGARMTQRRIMSNLRLAMARGGPTTLRTTSWGAGRRIRRDVCVCSLSKRCPIIPGPSMKS
jgi:hypothetical protein